MMDEEVKHMEDEKIIELYWQRSQEAVAATAEKYGPYCSAIAGHILHSPRDTEECVNDTWLAAWNAMPPHRPSILSAFLGRLTRNLAFNRYAYTRAEKRGGGETELVLDELAELVSGGEDSQTELERRELIRALNEFLGGLSEKKRAIFLLRYWYVHSVGDIAGRFAMKETAVSMVLHRLRRELRQYLTERGVAL